MGARRWVAAALALVAWCGLVLQYVILVQKIGMAVGTWRFFGFFTILSNIGIASIASAIALDANSPLTSGRARLMGLTAIVTVGFIYSLLLRSLWNPQGLQKLADAALHDWTPLIYAGLWALMPHGELKWGDLKWALAPPALYLAYAMGRGAFDGWYPYYFLDPTLQTGMQLGANILGTLAVFAVVAGSAVAVDKRMGKPKRAPA